jgi:hypothetical protein
MIGMVIGVRDPSAFSRTNEIWFPVLTTTKPIFPKRTKPDPAARRSETSPSKADLCLGHKGFQDSLIIKDICAK